MKNFFIKTVKVVGILFIVAFIFYAVFFSNKFVVFSISAVKIYALTVLPLTLPFLTATQIFTFFIDKNTVLKPLKSLSKNFSFNAEILLILLQNLLIGYPFGIKSLITVYRNRAINEFELERAVKYAYIPSPLLIIGAVGILSFNSIKIGVLIYASIFLSTVLLSPLFNKNISKLYSINLIEQKANDERVFIAVKSVLISLAVSTFLFTYLNIFNSFTAINNLPSTFKGVIFGLIDTTFGCLFFTTPTPFIISICAFLFSIGGLYILAFSLYLLHKEKINARGFLIYKITQALFSFVFCYLFIVIFN
ncbi:MAG: hypothetical protein J6V68_05295 [Clostridia bacterium]|nr:hypothetical protein [Clostridia bacterium]